MVPSKFLVMFAKVSMEKSMEGQVFTKEKMLNQLSCEIVVEYQVNKPTRALKCVFRIHTKRYVVTKEEDCNTIRAEVMSIISFMCMFTEGKEIMNEYCGLNMKSSSLIGSLFAICDL